MVLLVRPSDLHGILGTLVPRGGHLEFIIGDRQAACKVAALRATPDLLKEGGITQYAVLPLAIAADYTSAAYQAFRCD